MVHAHLDVYRFLAGGVTQGVATMHEQFQTLVGRIARDNGAGVSAEFEDGTLLVMLDAPGRLNAFDVAMHRSLAAVLDFADTQDSVRAVILSGRGRAFSSGQDLDSVRTDATRGDLPTPSQLLDDWYGPLVLRICEAQYPVIAAVNGVAAGGAANIALACDIAIAARGARFIQGFTKIALMPDCGGTWFLPRLVGDARARAMLLLDEPIDAETAERIGLIYRCVDAAELIPTARQIATKLGETPRAVVARIKQAHRASWKNDLADQLRLERELQSKAESDPAFREGVAAFRERRQPVFR